MPFQCPDLNKLYANDSKIKKEDINLLQEWLTKQPHLPHIREYQLLIFLHSCYYSVEATKITIDKYYTLRTQVQSLFDRLPLGLMEETLRIGFINILPEKTDDNYIILMAKLVDFKTDRFCFPNHVKAFNMVSSLYLHKHGYVFGAQAIFDMKGFTLAHLARFDLIAVKHLFFYIQEALPVRIKGLHFINVVSFIDKVIALIKPFLSGELLNLMHFHRPNELVYKYIPQKCLPEEYGGQAPSTSKLQDQIIDELTDCYDFFEWHDTQKVEESKRLDKQNSGSNIFGLEGTFKKLDLD